MTDIQIESMVTITGAEYVRLTGENERLRQVLENIQQARVLQGKAIIDANNEIERLRAALERIADTDPDEGTHWFHDVARAALGGEQ